MEIPLHQVLSLTEAIKEKLEETRAVKVKLQKLINSGCVWCRILSGTAGQDLNRIGMVTGLITNEGKLLFEVKILMRTGPYENRKYLWSEASWTRSVRESESIACFTLENKGGKVKVPRMEFQGNIDGPCVVHPENWFSRYCYNGATIGEGYGFPHPEN